MHPRLSNILRQCDQVISDNMENFRIGVQLGLREDQISELSPVPGTGGVDVAALSASCRDAPPSGDSYSGQRPMNVRGQSPSSI